MIDVQKHGGKILGWTIGIVVELILLAVCPWLGVLVIAGALLCLAV